MDICKGTVSAMSGAANFKILVSRPSRSRVPDCFKCFRVLYTSVTVNGEGVDGLQVCFEYYLIGKMLQVCLNYALLLVEFLVIIFSATVAE